MHSKTALFLACNASYSHTSLAAGYLGAAAGATGWQWQILEAPDGADLPNLLNRMSATAPHILAATFYLFNRQRLLTIIRRFKALQPDCIVIGGGPEFDGDNRTFLAAEPAIDLVLRGEGDVSFPDWLRHCDDRDRWHAVPGVCYLDRYGHYHDGGWAVTATELDRLPSPYPLLTDIARKPFIQLETSRGCGNRCAFCRGGGPGGLRFFGLPRIRRELQALHAAGIRQIRILDRTFNEPESRSQQLLRLFIDEFSDLRFHLEIDPGRLTDTFVNILADAPAGQFHLETGIQTLHPDAWRRMRRGNSPQLALSGLRTLTAMPNLSVHADLIAGLPGVDPETLRHDINTLVTAGTAEIQLEILKVLPGTPFRERAANEGLVYAPDPSYEVLRTREMTTTDLAVAGAWSRAIDWFYNVTPLQATVRAAAGRFPDFWDRAAAVVQRHAPGTVGAPGLRNRFLWLADMLVTAPDLVNALRLEWMKQGLGERAGFVEPRPWRGPVPAAAEPVDGAPPASATALDGRPVRRLLVRLDRDYILVYRTNPDGRRETTVYRFPAGYDPQKASHSTTAP